MCVKKYLKTLRDSMIGIRCRLMSLTATLPTSGPRNKQMAAQTRRLLHQRPIPFNRPQLRQLIALEPSANTNPGIMAGDLVAAGQPQQAAEPNRPKPAPRFDRNEQ